MYETTPEFSGTNDKQTELQVDVYKKPTVVSIPFPLTCHHLCYKRTVVNTLLRRPNNIPSTNKGRREETQRVKAVLQDNNYPMSFIQNYVREGVNQTTRRKQLQ